MFQSLYSRLALVLLSVFLVMAMLFFWLFERASVATQNEASQRLHLQLAENIVKDLGVTSQGNFDTEMIKEAFHEMMILGPAIELYIVDQQGNLIEYGSPEEKIKLRKVDIKPILAFVRRTQALPILGDDPRSKNKQKIFSAAEVYAKKIDKNVFLGYLYIIIGGEDYDSVATALRQSKAWKISLIGVAGALLFLLLASLLLFYALTRPLRRLTHEIKMFEESDFKEISEGSVDSITNRTGEINQLKTSFHQMEQRIVAQLSRLNKQDNIRREFLAYVSHDLRTPLAGTKAYLETLELKEDISEQEKQHFLQKAIVNVDRLEGMINELFEFTRLESHQVALNEDEFSIGDLLSDIYSSFEDKAKQENVRLLIECDNPNSLVCADIAKIERVIQNLLENAIRYSGENGKVVLSAQQKLSQQKEKPQIEIKIADSGSGIAEKDLAYIFEPYYRASDDYKLKHKGAGLGLAISQRLLALHGIELKVDTQKAQGTVFYFCLKS